MFHRIRISRQYLGLYHQIQGGLMRLTTPSRQGQSDWPKRTTPRGDACLQNFNKYTITKSVFTLEIHNFFYLLKFCNTMLLTGTHGPGTPGPYQTGTLGLYQPGAHGPHETGHSWPPLNWALTALITGTHGPA